MRNAPTFKAIFAHPIMVRDLLDWVADLYGLRELVDALDLNALRRGPEQSVAGGPANLRGSASDQVWLAPFAASPDPDPNAWRSLTVLLEFQRSPDYAMGKRIHAP